MQKGSGVAEPDRDEVHRRLAARRRRAWLVGAVLPGLIAIAVGAVRGQGGDVLSMVLVGVGVGVTAAGIIGMAGEFAHKGPGPTDAPPTPVDAGRSDRVAIPVEGDDDTITVNVFHLLRASWATTVDLPDGTTLVASADGDILELRDGSTGRITRARVGPSGSVSVGSASESRIIEGALRALAEQLMGAGFGYEPSVTVRAGPAEVAAGT